MNFKIGDRVRCIDDYWDIPNNVQTLVKGREYVVQDVDVCCEIRLNVGAISIDYSTPIACQCRKHWVKEGDINTSFNARRFVKVQEKYKAVTIQIEKEEPILS